MTKFREHLASGRPLLLDGAMGTRLYDLGIFINQSFDNVCLTHPDHVRRVHREYVDAGSDIIETNTFGANRIRLHHFGLDHVLKEINQAAVRLAREAAEDRAMVAASMGPVGVKLEPYGALSYAELQAVYREQAEILAAEGVDLFILETFSRLAEVREAVRGIRAVSDAPILACLTINEEGTTLLGTQPATLLPHLEALDLDAVGLNCSVGPRAVFDCLETLIPTATLPLLAMPNAGTPKAVDGRNMYLCSPEYMATYARRFLRQGVRILGGCCGTNPEHIAAMRRAFDQDEAFSVEKKSTPQITLQEQDEPFEVQPLAERSKWGRKLESGAFVVTVEVLAPRGCDPRRTLKRIAKLRDAGCDAVNIPDGPRASSRMSPLILATMVEQQLGMETILHYCCRDRNILGIQSDLLGGYAAGLKNILAVTGDPPKLGDYPDATAVFDVDSIGLTNILNGLNHGRDIGGNTLSKPTGYAVGVALNPCAVNQEEELARFRWKVDAGADFAITQPVFDADAFCAFVDKIGPQTIPIIAGVWPLASYKNAEFMNNEVPGVFIPDEAMARMREAGNGEAARAEGVQISLENIARIRHLISGIQVSAPLGKIELALEIVNQM